MTQDQRSEARALLTRAAILEAARQQARQAFNVDNARRIEDEL